MTGNMPGVVIMGGSLGGLTAALFLRDLGCRVKVLERSRTPLAGRGAGIVLNPATVRYFTLRGTRDVRSVSVATNSVRYLGADGRIAAEQQKTYRFSSYNAMYHALLEAFGPDEYHLGRNVTGFEQDAQGVTVHVDGAPAERCDLLICAGGVRSPARSWLLGDAPLEYAGYVAWRGMLSQGEVTPETFALLRDAIVYDILPAGHVLIYPIPVIDEGMSEPEPYINWLWYRNVPAGPAFDALMTDEDGKMRDVSLGPGEVRGENVAALRRDAEESLPPPLAELIRATKEPFIQAMMDCEIPRMAFGRVALMGDGAFVARPHAAAGTAKAAEDGWQLSLALERAGGDVPAALKQWETGQLALGRSLVERNRQAGHLLQNGIWPVGAPLSFGLYETGDSVMP
ncbi:MAG: FAD-dependent monooxygenase [Burkholderiales bacterium]